jgi:hypothetical protein
MTDDDATAIAEQFIAGKTSSFKYELIGVVRVPRLSGEVNVSFSVTSPEGKTYDGPVVVIINEETRAARFHNDE